jgi:predicted acyltransferase
MEVTMETRQPAIVLPAAEAPTVPKPAAARLVSLDAFRGFIMFWIVGGGAIALGLQALGHSWFTDTVIYQLNHSAWEGLRFYDCIWPSFMLMVGVSIPFSYAKRSLTQTHQQMLFHAVKRFAILMLLGGMRESVSLGSPRLIELSSALQPIAVASLAAFLLVRRSWRFQAIVGASILVGYLLLLALVPVPGVGSVSYQQGANLVYAVDKALLPHRTGEAVFLEGWGTILSTIPCIATTILGLLFGRLLKSQLTPQRKMTIIGTTGLCGLVIGYAISLFVPVVMKMWTTSYGILSASWSCLMFLFFYWIVDVLGYRRWVFVFVIIGMNALAVYLCNTVTRLHEIVGIFTRGPAAAMGPVGPLFAALAFFAVEWSILYWMYKRKLFLTA